MVENPRLLGWPSHRSGQEVLDLLVQDVVGRNPHGVEDSVLLQVFVDVGPREGGIGAEVKLPALVLVPVDDWFEQVLPAVGRVDVNRPQDSTLAVAQTPGPCIRWNETMECVSFSLRVRKSWIGNVGLKGNLPQGAVPGSAGNGPRAQNT